MNLDMKEKRGYYNKDILKIIKNAVEWTKPNKIIDELKCYHVKEPIEKI